MVNLDGVFRREWGPAVAAIAWWSGDLSIAEDAVQEACAEALRAWPHDGLPDRPGAWLITVARNRATVISCGANLRVLERNWRP